MTSEHVPKNEPACPKCLTRWRTLPTAAPLTGYQPVLYSCRSCHQLFVLVYKISLGRGVRWSLIAAVETNGRHPERVREALHQVEELDEDLIELTVILLSSRPEMRALIKKGAGVARRPH